MSDGAPGARPPTPGHLDQAGAAARLDRQMAFLLEADRLKHVLRATTLVDGLKANFPDVKPWNVELFGGSPDDNNAFFFYDGAMSVIQPLID